MIKIENKNINDLQNFNKILYKINDNEYYTQITKDDKQQIIIYDDDLNIIKSVNVPSYYSDYILRKFKNIYLLFCSSILRYATTNFEDYKIPNHHITLEDFKNNHEIEGKIIIVKRTFNGTFKTYGLFSENGYDWVEFFRNKNYNTSIINDSFANKCFVILTKETENEEGLKINIHYMLFNTFLIIFDSAFNTIDKQENINVIKIDNNKYMIYNKDTKDFYKIENE